ncbi:MAG TPA: hypothetical protein VFW44_14375 [Bryobacteraceae bacterium]|nr:hypothetical protein [Bryobacteraceae bacterium]
MKTPIILLALAAFASFAAADTLTPYDDATVVTGPDGNPAWQLTSPTDGGLELQITNPLTPTTLTDLSADYVMLNGTFGNGAPRFTLFDNSLNSAWIYWGTPAGGGSFTDPNSGNTNYMNTGNYADLASPDVRVYSNGFGGDSNPNTGVTWAQFVALTGGTNISYITLDLDGGTPTNNQVMDTTNFDVNGTIYVPTAATPEPRDISLALCGIGLAGLILRRHRQAAR